MLVYMDNRAGLSVWLAWRDWPIGGSETPVLLPCTSRGEGRPPQASEALTREMSLYCTCWLMATSPRKPSICTRRAEEPD